MRLIRITEGERVRLVVLLERLLRGGATTVTLTKTDLANLKTLREKVE